MNNPINQKSISRYVKLKDYKVFDYEIPEIFLDFVIKKNLVNVTTKLKLVKKNKNTRNLILDGTDNVKSRKEINKACVNYEKPLIFGGVSGWEGTISFLLKDGAPCYECIFPGIEEDTNELNCNSEGVLGSTTALVGSYMAAETIKYVCNTGNILTNKLLVFDCLNGVFEVFSVEKNVKCLVCNNKY